MRTRLLAVQIEAASTEPGNPSVADRFTDELGPERARWAVQKHVYYFFFFLRNGR